MHGSKICNALQDYAVCFPLFAGSLSVRLPLSPLSFRFSRVTSPSFPPTLTSRGAVSAPLGVFLGASKCSPAFATPVILGIVEPFPSCIISKIPNSGKSRNTQNIWSTILSRNCLNTSSIEWSTLRRWDWWPFRDPIVPIKGSPAYVCWICVSEPRGFPIYFDTL